MFSLLCYEFLTCLLYLAERAFVQGTRYAALRVAHEMPGVCEVSSTTFASPTICAAGNALLQSAGASKEPVFIPPSFTNGTPDLVLVFNTFFAPVYQSLFLFQSHFFQITSSHGLRAVVTSLYFELTFPFSRVCAIAAGCASSPTTSQDASFHRSCQIGGLDTIACGRQCLFAGAARPFQSCCNLLPPCFLKYLIQVYIPRLHVLRS